VSVVLFSLRTKTPCNYVVIVTELCNFKNVLENSEISEVKTLETQRKIINPRKSF
jgi:hypothetical protein